MKIQSATANRTDFNVLTGLENSSTIFKISISHQVSTPDGTNTEPLLFSGGSWTMDGAIEQPVIFVIFVISIFLF